MTTRRFILQIGFVLIIYSLLAFITRTLHAEEYLGRLGGNRFCGDCTSNPFSLNRNPFYADSFTNRFGPYGNFFSPYSPRSPFGIDTPSIYGHADDAYGSGSASSYEDNSYANSPTDGEYSFDYQ